MKFSVLMSVYYKDNAEWFQNALESVSINQTIKPNQIVIVQDGIVSDEIQDIINNVSSKNKDIEFTIVKLPNNLGLASALNKGIEFCKYDWIARMDSDDISVSDRFEKQVKFLINHPSVEVLGGFITEFEDSLENLKHTRNVELNHNKIIKMANTRTPMNHVTVIFRKESIEKVGFYDTSYGKLEDYKLWIDLIANNAIIANIEDVLVYTRIGKDFIKRRSDRKEIKDWDNLQNYMHKIGFIGLLKMISNKMYIRAFTYAPYWLKKYIYKIFLRKNK